jgi:ATP/maltotriose-dependent transcriptional regulator MalT
VAAALDPACAGLAEQVAALLAGPQPPLESVVTALINELATQPDQVLLVLDDYHLIEAAAVHDSLTLLLERLPSQLRVVLAGRVDPLLPLARLRARGQLVELRERELRFTPQEAAALLGEVVGLDLPDSATCCAPACTGSGPTACLSCTRPRPPGVRRMGWSTTPSATRWPPEMPSGRPGCLSSTSTRC